MKILALAGGVGGAKLVDGLSKIIPPKDLSVIVNTGDDFRHFSLMICPDLDTVCYTLAGLANPETGWGRKNETWNVKENLEKFSAPNWFSLGDKDLSTHLERSRRLEEGESLSEITAQLCKSWGIKNKVLPMSNQEVPTIVLTPDGELSFQEYFVAQRCEPEVKGFRFDGILDAVPAPGVIDSILEADLVIICPSNPWVSIAPILGIPGIKTALEGKQIVAVSPIIDGKALKGPAAKMYAELKIKPSALAVAEHYSGLITGFVFDQLDSKYEDNFYLPILITDTIMHSLKDRQRLAEEIVLWANDHLQDIEAKTK